MSRKSTAARKVRRAYSQDALARICTLPERDFGRWFGMTTTEVESPYRSYRRGAGTDDWDDDLHYHFRDNGSSVLAVAHLDTVVAPGRRAPRFRNTERGPLIVSGALDDRLGAYVILDLLPKLGVTCDWLLTTGEESCQSTAGQFVSGKDYDHMIEFDRGGTDVVMYQYEDRASRAAVETAGAVMGHGSFSDVAALEQLGIKGFNWGVGYRGNYHSEAGYAYLNDAFGMVAKYLRFSEQNAGITMPHDPGYRESGNQHWWNADDDYRSECWTCGAKDAVENATWYCKICGACADCGDTHPDIAAEWGNPDVDVCQCYTPASTRNETSSGSAWTASGYLGMTRDEYLARRDEREALNAALADAMERDRDPDTDTPITGQELRSRWSAKQEAPSLDSSGVWQAGDDPDSDPGRADAYTETGDTWTHPDIAAEWGNPGAHAHARTDGL